MPARARRSSTLLLPAGLALSLLLHLGLIAIPLDQPEPASTPEPRTITLRFLTPEAPPEPVGIDPIQPPDPGASAEPVVEAPTTPLIDPITPDPVTVEIPGRMQIIGSIRDLARDAEARPGEPGMTFRPAPELPSRPGWLNQYTGTVAPSVERWRGNDGSFNSRVVLSQGQVLCFTTRAPTIQEVFNPWMSVAVPMMRNCGRERPEAPDRSNPWLRAPRGSGD